MNAVTPAPRIPPVPYEPCSDAFANLARRIRATASLSTEERQELLDAVMDADRYTTMVVARHDALRDRVILPRFSLLDLLPPLPRFRRGRPVR